MSRLVINRFGIPVIEENSSKERALSKLNDIVLLFTEEYKFDLNSLVELHDLILSIREAEDA